MTSNTSDWLTNACYAVDDPVKFNSYLNRFRLEVDTFLETGKFRNISERFQIYFINCINKQILVKIKEFGELDSEEIGIILEFYKILVDFVKQGFLNKDYRIISISYSFITNYDATIYVSNPDLYEDLISYCVEVELFQTALKVMKEKLDFHGFYFYFYFITHVKEIGKYIDLEEFFQKSLDIIDTCCRETPRDVPTNDLNGILSVTLKLIKRQSIIPSKQFYHKWLELLKFFASSEFFEKQLFGYTSIKAFLENFYDDMAIWDLDSSFFELPTSHAEIMKIFGEICGLYAKKGLLKVDVLQSMWEKLPSIHSSELTAYYEMFLHIAMLSNSQLLNELTRIVAQDNIRTEPYLVFIQQFSLILGRMKDGNRPFMVVRDLLFRWAMDESDTLSGKAAEALSSVFQYHIDSASLSETVKSIPENPKSIIPFTVIQQSLQNIPLTCDITKLEDKIYQAMINFPEQRELLFQVLYNVCSCNNHQPQLERFFSTVDEPLLVFASLMLENDLLPEDFCANFIRTCDSKLSLFMNFVQTFIIRENDIISHITHVPLKYEDLLWEFSFKNPQSQLLCDLFAKNDQTLLSDYNTQLHFLNQWLKYSKKYNNGYEILLRFIKAIETGIDITRFGKEYKQKNQLEIMFFVKSKSAFESVMLPGDIPISVLHERIAKVSKIPYESFCLYQGDKYLGDSNLIKTLDQKNGSKIKLIPKEVVRTFKHVQRSCIPSLLIAKSPYIDYLLHNSIPAYSILAEIPKQEVNFELHFVPNVRGLLLFGSKEIVANLDNQGLMKEFLKENSLATVEVIRKYFTDEMIMKYSQEITDLFFNNIAIASLDIIKKLKINTKLPLKELLGSNSKKALSIFAGLDAPVSDFVPFLSGTLTSEFIHSLAQHYKEINKDVESFVLSIIKMPANTEPEYYLDILKLLESMLKFGTSDNFKEEVSEVLIEKSLSLDSQEDSRKCFEQSLKCLGIIQSPLLYKKLAVYHDNKNSYSDWNIDGDSNTVSKDGNVGLINLGATCFLNSTLQQLYAVPPLRKAVIEYSGTDDFTLELQRLFANLYSSKKEYLDTTMLCKVWKDYEGMPINPLVQQDAIEFMQMLLEKLESSLGAEFMQSLFNYKTADTIEGITEDYKSTKEQPLCPLTLQVKGLNNVDESFQRFLEPELFTGKNKYSVESLGKIDIKKTTKLVHIPDYAILQLSRFSYNYATWQRQKINSVYEFPSELDFAPISSTDEPTKYRLTGIIVHMGSADFGHYVSFTLNRKTNKWIYFNDTKVKEVTLANVLETGYGKESLSAYILFYDRIGIDYDTQVNIPDALHAEIEEENTQLRAIRLFCSKGYAEFMKQLAQLKNQFSVFPLKYLFDTLPYTNHVEYATPIAESLLEVFDLIEKDFLLILEHGNFCVAMAYSPDPPVKKAVLDLFSKLDPMKITPNIFANMIKILSHIIPYKDNWNEYFLCLLHAYKNTDLDRKKLQTNLDFLLTALIPKYYQEKRQSFTTFCSKVNFDGMISLLLLYPHEEDFYCFVSAMAFIGPMLLSDTNMELITKLLFSVPEDYSVDKTVQDIIDRFKYNITSYRILEFLILYNNKTVFPNLNEIFKPSIDLADGFIIIANNYKTVLANNLELWFYKYLFNKTVDIRNKCIDIINALLPESKTLLAKLIEAIPLFKKKVFANKVDASRGITYIIVFGIVLNANYNESAMDTFKELFLFVLDHSTYCDNIMFKMLTILNEHNIKLDQSTIKKILEKATIKGNTIARFFTLLYDHIRECTFDSKFCFSYITNIAFINGIAPIKEQALMPIIRHLASFCDSSLDEFVMNNLDMNFSILLTLVDARKIKADFNTQITKNISLTCAIPMDNVVSIIYNSCVPLPHDLNVFIEWLSNDFLNEESRKLVWKMLKTNPPNDLNTFITNYIPYRDFHELAEFLVDKEDGTKLLIEATMRDRLAFKTAFKKLSNLKHNNTYINAILANGTIGIEEEIAQLLNNSNTLLQPYLERATKATIILGSSIKSETKEAIDSLHMITELIGINAEH